MHKIFKKSILIKWLFIVVFVSNLKITTAQTPYGGARWSLPGIIQIENFDVGGQGVAYYDSDASNTGGQYRPGERVDIWSSDDEGGGYCVGKPRNGEWLKYSINIENGRYAIFLRYASSLGSGKLIISLDGIDMFSFDYDPTSGDWMSKYVGSINVTDGINKILQLRISGTYLTNLPKLNWIEFQKITPTSPGIPSNLTSTATQNLQISLSWADNATSETGFTIERKTSSGSYSQIATVAANVTTYTDNGLQCGTAYFYRVAASNGPVNSSYSNESSATTIACPSTPTGMSASANSNTQIGLVWTDNASNETGYRIERSTTISSVNPPFNVIATVGANVNTYVDDGLKCSMPYYYRVIAYNGDGNSNYSNISSAITKTCIETPTVLYATANSNTQINLNWTDNASNETGYRIERSTTSNGSYNIIATLGANVNSYADNGLQCSTLYYYKVLAYNGDGNSNYSNESSAITRTCIQAPTGLSATANSNTQISLNWTDNASNETGFEIYRSTYNSPLGVLVGTVGQNANTYIDEGLQCSIQYYYIIRAFNNDGNSDNSNQGFARTKDCILTPTDLNVTANSNAQINLNWTDNASNEIGYRIERSTTTNGSYSVIDTLGANVNTYIDNGLLCGTIYFYRVVAYNSFGNSEYSLEANTATDTCALIYLNTTHLGNEYSFTLSGAVSDSISIFETGNRKEIAFKPPFPETEIPEIILHFTSNDNLEVFNIKLQITDLLEIRPVLFEKDGEFLPFNNQFYSIDTTEISLFSDTKIRQGKVLVMGVDGVTKIPEMDISVNGLEAFTTAGLSVYNAKDKNTVIRSITGNLIWDGKDSNGVTVNPGVYLLVIYLNDGSGKTLNSQVIIK